MPTTIVLTNGEKFKVAEDIGVIEYEISTTINSNHPWIILEVLIDKNQWVRRRIMIFSISYWE